MSIQAIADDFTALCRAGKLDEAGDRYWSDDVVSLEKGDGDMARAEGLAAVKGKGEWWAANHEIHGFETEGPFVNGDQFAVIFRMDITRKQTGERVKMDEVAVYTVRGDNVVEERFLY
ncbi:MAG: nuclear transport factor 2 family protein [Pseudomonadota bacterium]